MPAPETPGEGSHRSRPVQLSLWRMEAILEDLGRQATRLHERWDLAAVVRLQRLLRELAALSDGQVRRSAAELEALLLGEEAEASALCEKVEALVALFRGQT